MRHIRLITLLLASVSACGGEPDPGESAVAALDGIGMPFGTTCGLSYQRPGSPVFGNNFCDGSITTGRTSERDICIGTIQPPDTPNGFHWVADGDRGLPSCNGFAHFRFNRFASGDSWRFRIPRGTACGFKEACNNRGETCMGFDANVSCPAGWAKKVASDMKAPSGCGYVWCEYQDPDNLCTDRACQFDNQPFGLICGITDNDRNNGQCQGQATVLGCPFGYQRYGYFDDGRSPGHGVGWCSRSIIVP